jgi:hypothetical protein
MAILATTFDDSHEWYKKMDIEHFDKYILIKININKY